MVVKMRFRLAAISSLVFLTSCSAEPSCENEVLSRSPNPSGHLVAVVFSRNCGATVGENMQVSIVRRDDNVTGKGNALITDKAPSYSDAYKPTWSGDRSVVLIVPAAARTFLQEKQVSGVSVIYKRI
jgi:hypothetical protein